MRYKIIVHTLLGAVAMAALFIGLCQTPAAADSGSYATGTSGTFNTDYYAGGIPFTDQSAHPKYYQVLQPFCTSAYQTILAEHPDMIMNWCGEPSFPDNQFAYNVPGSGDFAVHVATHYILTCNTGQFVKWNGENAPPECVNTEPVDCSSKAGHSVNITQQCGTVACAIGQTWLVGSDGKSSCSSGSKSGWPTATPHPSPISKDGCEAVFDHTVGISILKADAGKQSVPAYCNDQYQYTGQAANSSDGQPNQGANAGLTADTNDPTDGGCPAGTFHGTGPLGESCYGTPSDGANSGSPNGTGNSGGVPNGTGNSGGTGNDPNGTANSGSPNGTSNSGGSGGSGAAHGSANSGSNSGCTDCTADTAGDCESPPPCSGDAIQCAILVQSWKNTCYMTHGPDSGKQGDADEAAASGAKDYTEQQKGFSDGVKSIMDNFFSSADGNQYQGSCPGDIDIPYVNGQQIVIAVSRWCPAMQIIRMLLLAFAYLSAARIIFNAAL